uniref:Atherin n=1 Tax=Cacopsylla melanoneura TaxID=428564 RepID=A0A8D9A0V1_9HEMI
MAGRESHNKGDLGAERKPATWKMKKRKCYADPKDEDFKPGSKDFKVDLSLERQSRKRKEKKIFDPSALDSKGSRKGRNGSLVKGSGTPGSVGEAAKISPGKKMPATSGLGCGKLGGPSSTMVPPGAAPIIPLVPSSVCYVCQTYGKRIKGVPEKLISCVKCTTSKAHISCLNDVRGSNEKLMTPSAVNNWTCKKCSQILSCVYCNQIKPGVVILECTGCKSGFHIPCHRSLIPALMNNVTLVPATFKCVRCVPPQQQQASNPTPGRGPQRPQPRLLDTAEVQQQKPKSTTPPDQQQSQQQVCPKVTVTQLKPKVNSIPTQVKTTNVPPKPDLVTTPPACTPPTPLSLAPSHKPPSVLPWSSSTLQQDPYANIPIDESVPDCTKWTAADVFEYLSAYLKPELCKPLLDGDVDGSALLLLKRSDCIRNLGLPLGFSLKLWTHVKRLQTRRSEIEIYWE